VTCSFREGQGPGEPQFALPGWLALLRVRANIGRAIWHGGAELGEEGPSRLFSLTSPFLDERRWRLLAMSMVEVLSRGGQARVAVASGMSRNTLIAGAKDLAEGPLLGQRVRRPGAGPKRKIDLAPELRVALGSLVGPQARGDPEAHHGEHCPVDDWPTGPWRPDEPASLDAQVDESACNRARPG